MCKSVETGDGRLLVTLCEVYAHFGQIAWLEWAEPRPPDGLCLCGVDVPATARLRGWEAVVSRRDPGRYELRTP